MIDYNAPNVRAVADNKKRIEALEKTVQKLINEINQLKQKQ